MGTETTSVLVHPEGEPPEVETWSAVADTYAGRVHVEWDATAPVTPFGQLPFFIEYLKQGGLFDSSPLGRSRWFCGSVAATYWLVGSAPEICQLSSFTPLALCRRCRVSQILAPRHREIRRDEISAATLTTPKRITAGEWLCTTARTSGWAL